MLLEMPMDEQQKRAFEENTWNERIERKPVFRWLILGLILAILAYISSGA